MKCKEKILKNGGEIEDEKALILALWGDWELMQRRHYLLC